MRYLLDTNICIYIINKKDQSLLHKLQSFRYERLWVSAITVAELEYGICRSSQPDRNRIALVSFLLPFQILDFDQAAAGEYGSIRMSLETQGRIIGPMPLLLAAQARSRELTLVTNNEKEFKRIPGLAVANWTR